MFVTTSRNSDRAEIMAATDASACGLSAISSKSVYLDNFRFSPESEHFLHRSECPAWGHESTRFAAAGSCSAMWARKAMRSLWIPETIGASCAPRRSALLTRLPGRTQSPDSDYSYSIDQRCIAGEFHRTVETTVELLSNFVFLGARCQNL
jgi:hypothetical protein